MFHLSGQMMLRPNPVRSLESWFMLGKAPGFMAEQFRLVKYFNYNLPRSMCRSKSFSGRNQVGLAQIKGHFRYDGGTVPFLRPYFEVVQLWPKSYQFFESVKSSHLWNYNQKNSYGHLLVVTGYKWNYTSYKWGFVSTYNW